MKVVRFGLKTNLTTLFIMSKKTKLLEFVLANIEKGELAKNIIFSKQAAITPDKKQKLVVDFYIYK